jgi:hypothetical protein
LYIYAPRREGEINLNKEPTSNELDQIYID